jgi:serine/threonine protein kinase
MRLKGKQKVDLPSHEFSDSANSTTTGRPLSRTLRYAAPEAFHHEPRNRLTDIWGLGCVLFEIYSRLRGYKLSAMKKFWKLQGNGIDSFTGNREATKAWFNQLTQNRVESQHGWSRKYTWLFSFIYHVLLNENRLFRPSSQQILDRLQDLDAVYPIDAMVARCCIVHPGLTTSLLASYRCIPQWPMLDLILMDKNLAHVFLDVNLRVLATGGSLSNLKDEYRTLPNMSNQSQIGQFIMSRDEENRIKDAVHALLESLGIRNNPILDMEADMSDITDSVLTNSLKDTGFWVDVLSVVIKSGGVPHLLTVQLSLYTVCFERRSSYRKTFLVMTFDPTQSQVVENAYLKSRNVWTDGFAVKLNEETENISGQGEEEMYRSIKRDVSARENIFTHLVSCIKQFGLLTLRLTSTAREAKNRNEGIFASTLTQINRVFIDTAIEFRKVPVF